MIVGREAERARISYLVQAARQGRSHALVLLGEAGIGKSTLLAYAEEEATGFTILRASGTESEAELAFSGLADLLRPLLGHLGTLAGPQAEALSSALALSPPAPGDPFAVGMAVLALVARAAEEKPVAALVEDAQWLDQPSLAGLLFVARRIQAEGVLMLFAVREAEGSARAFDSLDVIHLSGVGTSAAAALLGGAAARLAPTVVAKIISVANGNPLALLEMPASLSEGQRAGSEALDEPLPAGPGLTLAYQRRLALLSAPARSALLLAAASDGDEVDVVTAGMDKMALEPAALEEAEDAGFISVRDGRLNWRHPLVRAAVYHGALPSARRAAHRALASALEVGAGRAGYEPDSRAWHLAAAAMGDDDQAADALELSALSARARRGSSAAARAFERSARLTASRSKRARRLYEAALDFLFTPEAQRAGPLLFEALSLIDDPLLRADVQRARAVAEMFRGPSEVNIETLIAEADLVEPIDVGRAAAMRADACMASTMVGDVARTLELARRAHESAQQAGPQAVAVSQAVLANALILSGQSQKAQAYLDFAREAFERDGLPPFPFLLHMIQTLGHAATWVEEYDQARQFLGAMVSAARAQSAAAGLAFALSCLSELDYRTGKWAEAYAHAAESERIATELGERNEVPFALVCLARVEAASGREAECQAHVAQALHISRELGSGSIEVYAGSVLGLLELGLGRPRQALAHLGPLALLVDRFQLAEPNVVPWAADHIEALVRAGDTSSAQAALASFERQAVATERRWALAESARCRGLLASDDEFEDCFEEALRWLDGRVALFETARARLCLGERQRRARRVGPARESLTAALAGFEQLGAQPWALRARQELRASGARLGPLADQPVQRLTAQELQVALAVASGATNREVAASLFLSPKTVDFHLGKVYRKLQVRSRSELAALLAGPRSVISKSV